MNTAITALSGGCMMDGAWARNIGKDPRLGHASPTLHPRFLEAFSNHRLCSLVRSALHSAPAASHHMAVRIAQRIPAGGRADHRRLPGLVVEEKSADHNSPSRRMQAKINRLIRCTVILRRLSVSAGGLLRAPHCKSITFGVHPSLTYCFIIMMEGI